MGTDSHTLRRAQRGDSAALVALLKLARPVALAAALDVLPTIDEAEEAAQEALVAVMRQLGDLREPQAFLAWVRGIARHKALSLARGKTRLASLDDEVADQSASVEALIERREDRAALQKAVDALPASSREAVVLSYWEDLGAAEVGAVLGLSEEAVRQRLSRARKALRMELLAALAPSWSVVLPVDSLPMIPTVPALPGKALLGKIAVGLAGVGGATVITGATALGIVWVVDVEPTAAEVAEVPEPPVPRASAPRSTSKAQPAAVARASEDPSRSRVPAPVAEGHAQNPKWSPDGKRLAFELNDLSTTSLWTIDLAGGIARNPQQMKIPSTSSAFTTVSQEVYDPTWHPEGILTFVGGNQGGHSRVYFGQVGGSAAVELLSSTKAPGNLSDPAFTPDGKVTYYVQDRVIASWDRSRDRYDVETPETRIPATPTVSGDGKALAFSWRVNGDTDLFELDLEGAQKREVASGPGDQVRPAYADGGIAYFAGTGDTWDLRIARDDGTDDLLAAGVRLPVRAAPAVGPRGDWIAYSATDPAHDGSLFLAAPDGSRIVEVPTPFVACGEPDLTQQNGRLRLAYTALDSTDASWRTLHIADVTDLVAR